MFDKAKIYKIDKNKFKLDNSYVLVKIDKNLLERAKALGIDISKESISEKLSMRGPGFEPGLTPRKGVVLPLDYPRL